MEVCLHGRGYNYLREKRKSRCTFLFFKLSVLVIFFNIDTYKNTLISSCIFFLDKEKNCPR